LLMMKFVLFALICAVYSIRVQVDPKSITISGISSGGAMATQLQVAYSSVISGSAIFASPPYFCAQNSLLYAVGECLNQPELISISTLETYTKQFAQQGLVDDLSNLKNAKMFFYSGIIDTVVFQPVVRLTQQMFQDLGVSNVASEYGILSEHCVPTVNYGNPCLLLSSPFISDCEYDGAGIALSQLYSGLKQPVSPNVNNIKALNQSKFTPNNVNPSQFSLSNFGYVYVPTACAAGTTQCKLHVSFHGCQQGYQTVGNVYIVNAGYNSWAEANNIIVVYPQAQPSLESPLNPEGCWDWWGYTNSNYANKNGVQMAFVRNIIASFVNGMEL